MTDFDEFMAWRQAAADAYVGGDPALLGEIVARTSPATFFGPRGGLVRGADEVWQIYEQDAASFGPPARNELAIVERSTGGEFAYWAGFQRSSATFDGRPTEFDLRVTEVFRRDDGLWRLVHRHADALAERPNL